MDVDQLGQRIELWKNAGNYGNNLENCGKTLENYGNTLENYGKKRWKNTIFENSTKEMAIFNSKGHLLSL